MVSGSVPGARPRPTIAHMIGHGSAQIVPRYAQVMDQNRLDAMKKLAELKKSAMESEGTPEPATDEVAPGIRQ